MSTASVPEVPPQPSAEPVKVPEQPTQPLPQPSEKLAMIDNRPIEIQKFEFQQRCARLFAASGLFSDIKGQTQEQAIAQAFVKIALGDSMGFNPAESMTGIDLIQGRVSVGSNLRAARMQRAGYSWDILQLDNKGCRLLLKFQGKPLMCEQIDGATGTISQVPTVVSFMAEDAAVAGLIGKDNYKKNPRNMYFARAITNAQRWYAPGILGVDILSTEEAIDMEPDPIGDGKLAAKSNEGLENIKQRYSAKNAAKTEGSTGSTPVNPSQAPEIVPSQKSNPPEPAPSTETVPEIQERRKKLHQQEQELSAKRSTPQPAQPDVELNFNE